MENGMMNGDRSHSPGITRSNSRGSMNRDAYGRTSLLRRNQSLNAKQISFYRNGDKFFRGLKLAVSVERYKEWDSLLAELSSKVDLPTGAVRYVFCSETGKMITDINELQYGMSYVCSSSNTFRDVEGGYGKENQPQWSLHNKKAMRDELNNWTDGKGGLEPEVQSGGPRDFIKPKLVTVIKNGKPPQKKVTMLLNGKTAASLNQVLDHLSAKGTLGKVDKLYTVSGKMIRTLRDLFDDDMIFVAFSSTEKPPEEGFDVEIQSGVRPPWKVSVVPLSTPYIPGLRPDSLPPYREFTTHLHCILDALAASPYSSPRPKSSRGTRASSVSPRLYQPRTPRTPNPPSPKATPRAATLPKFRPNTAIGTKTPDLGPKSLTPTRIQNLSKSPFKAPSGKPKAGSEKPIAIKPRPRPKAGSITPIAIRRPKPSPTSEQDMDQNGDSPEGPVIHEGRHGYYIYIHGEKVFTEHQSNADGKPMASVRPMLAIDLVGSETESDGESDKDFKENSTQDLKPIQLNFENTNSLEASQ